MNESNVTSDGPPKRKDRKFITAMIGAVTVAVIVLIMFALFSDFPDSSEGEASYMPPATFGTEATRLRRFPLLPYREVSFSEAQGIG
jgi:hypothetical protein